MTYARLVVIIMMFDSFAFIGAIFQTPDQPKPTASPSVQSTVTNEPKPSPSPSEISSITGYCRELAGYTKRNPKQARFFGDVSSYDQSGVTLKKPTEKWSEFKTQKARETATTEDNLYNTANVWLRDGSPVVSDFKYGSPSGDWAQFVSYCFRTDGSLAEIDNSFRTFNGSVRVEKQIVYNANGRRLRLTTRCFDLQSGRKKLCGGNYAQYDAEVFQKVQQLPFYHLLKSRSTRK